MALMLCFVYIIALGFLLRLLGFQAVSQPNLYMTFKVFFRIMSILKVYAIRDNDIRKKIWEMYMSIKAHKEKQSRNTQWALYTYIISYNQCVQIIV